MEVVRDVYSSVEQIVELPDGYALRTNPQKLQLLGEHVMRDRLCCAFIRWEIVVEQANGPVWLRIRGPRGTAEFVAAAIVNTGLIPKEVAQAAGFQPTEGPEVTLENVESFAKTISVREDA